MSRSSTTARAPRRRMRIALVSAVLVALGVGMAVPAAAVSGGRPISDPPGASTEATVVDLRDTSGLFGGTVPSATALTPYPSSGLQNQRSVSTAQIVLEDPASPGSEIVTYCIDIDTDTTVGVHYELGNWDAADVPNLPYVQWILQNYYPTVPSAPALGTTAEKVRAVQGAIWYFTDQFVVSRFYPTERNAVRAIVEAAQAAVNPTPTPPPLPTLTVSPASLSGAVPGTVVGPFTVGGSVSSATISFAPGTEVYADAAGTIPVADGATVAPGAQLWVRYDPAISGLGFTVTSSATVPSGNVFLYDGNNPPRTAAQKLILAATTTIPLRASASVTPQAAGALEIDTTIGGDAAGSQGQIDLTATCTAAGGWSLVRPIHIPAEAPAGDRTVTIPNVPATATCAVTIDDDGGNPYVDVTTSDVDPPSVTIAAGATSTVDVTLDYAVPVPVTGTLRVDVAIAGAAAGQQSALELQATCTLGTDSDTRTIPVSAGITGTTTVASFAGIPVGAECAVVQTVDGRNANAQLTGTTIVPASVTIADGVTSTITVTDTYAVPVPVTGTLRVDATIAGAAAGQQSALALQVVCTLDTDTDTRTFPVAAGVTGTTTVATIADIPVDTQCVLTQTADGANARATLASSVIAPASVTIRDGEVSVLGVTDTYALPAPSPSPTTPTPSPTALPATGSSGEFPWPLAGGLIGVGLLLLAADHVRRIRRSRG